MPGLAREAAREEVRRDGAGLTRAQQRTLLQRALARRGEGASPLWIEQALDRLSDSPADRAKASADALKQVGRLGLGVVRAIRSRTLPDLTPPDWIQPPPYACYELPTDDDWVQVHIDPQAMDWPAQVHPATPRAFGIAPDVPAWLRHDDEPSDRFGVHIGARRVGHLADDDATRFVAAVQAARFRDELPTVRARLTARPQPTRYLLEIAAPVRTARTP